MKKVRFLLMTILTAIIVFGFIACADEARAVVSVDDVANRISTTQPGDIRATWKDLRVKDFNFAVGVPTYSELRAEYAQKAAAADKVEEAEGLYDEFIEKATEMLDDMYGQYYMALRAEYANALKIYNERGEKLSYLGENAKVMREQENMFSALMYKLDYYENQYALQIYKDRCRALAGPELITRDEPMILQHFARSYMGGGPMREEYIIPTDKLGEDVTYDFIGLQGTFYTGTPINRERVLTGIKHGTKVNIADVYVVEGDTTSNGNVDYLYNGENCFMVLARENGHIIGCVIMRINNVGYGDVGSFTTVKSVVFPKDDEGNYQDVDYERLMAGLRAYATERHMVWGINDGKTLGLRINPAEKVNENACYMRNYKSLNVSGLPKYVVSTQKGTLSKLNAPIYVPDVEKSEERAQTITLSAGETLLWNNDSDESENTITVTEKIGDVELRTVTITVSKREDGSYAAIFTENYTFSQITVGDKNYILFN